MINKEGKGVEKKKRKTWGNTLSIDFIMKVQEFNIKGLTSFEERGERERMKEKRRKNNNV